MPITHLHRRALSAACILATLPAFHAAHAGKLPDCPEAVTPVVLVKGQGILESLVFDPAGRLLYNDTSAKALKVVARSGAEPTVLAGDLAEGGGLALGPQNEVYMGLGNGLGGLLPQLAQGRIVRIDLGSGAVTPYAKGLSMANGVVRAPDGTFYASDDLADSLDRVLPDGTVQRGWIKRNGNGLALSPDGRTLYMNQSLPAKVLAIDTTTAEVRTVATAPDAQSLVFIDGLTRDDAGRLYSAAFLAGQLWRIDANTGAICVLARGMPFISSVTPGKPGQGFSATSLYTATFAGKIYELPGVLAPR